MFLVKMLCEMHVSLSNSDEPPFTHEKKFDKEKVNYEILEKIKNEDSLANFALECLETFNKKYPHIPFGSVHNNPSAWIVFVMNAIVKKINEDNKLNNNIIIYPNGCCTKKDCPINLFYDMVHDILLSK